MFIKEIARRFSVLLLIASVVGIAFPSGAAPATKPTPAASAKKKTPPKKPVAKKKAPSKPKQGAPVAPAVGIAAKLKAIGLTAYEQRFEIAGTKGTNLYAEIPPTALPDKPVYNKKGKVVKQPKRISNAWNVIAVARNEPGPDGVLTDDVSAALKAAKRLNGSRLTSLGTIVVFLDPASANAAEPFAELLGFTQRTVIRAYCVSQDQESPSHKACDMAFCARGFITRPATPSELLLPKLPK